MAAQPNQQAKADWGSHVWERFVDIVGAARTRTTSHPTVASAPAQTEKNSDADQQRAKQHEHDANPELAMDANPELSHDGAMAKVREAKTNDPQLGEGGKVSEGVARRR